MDSLDRKQVAFLGGLAISGSIILIGSAYGGDSKLSILILGFLTMVGCAIHGVKYDLRHPWVWFGAGFALYSVGSPVLYLMDLYQEYDYYNQVIILEYIALLSFLIGAFCERNDYSAISYQGLAEIRVGAPPIMLVSFAISALYLASWLALGNVMKTEKHFRGNMYLKLDIAYNVLIITFLVIAVARVRKIGSPPYLLFSFMTAYFLFSFLIGGERGILARLALSSLLMYITINNRPVNRAYLFAGILALIAMSTVIGMYKNYILTREVTAVAGIGTEEVHLSRHTVALLLFGSEFRTPAANLAKLTMEVPERISFWWGKSTLMEVISVFHVGVITDRDVLPSTASWFAREFFPGVYELGGGEGFTLVGQGYLDFGTAGVILLFWTVGVVVRRVYVWSGKSVIGLVVYVGMVPSVLYSIRQTVAPAISQTLKHVVIPLLLMYIVGKAVRGYGQLRGLGCTLADASGNGPQGKTH